MNQNKLKIAGLSLGVIFLSFIGSFIFYNYLPLSLTELDRPEKFGTTITTINGGDTISSSRSVINTNFSNLNVDLVSLEADVNNIETASSTPYITVCDSGCNYITDGTADDVQINSALVSALTSKSIVLVKGSDSDYDITNPVKVFADSYLIGEGENTVFKLASGTDKNIIENNDLVSGTDTFFRISNITFDGNKASNTKADTVNCISLTNAEDYTITDVRLNNCAYNGIRLNSSERGKIKNASVTRSGDSGIIIFNGSDNLIADGVTTRFNSDSGVRIAGSDYSMLTNVWSSGNGNDGIKFDEYGGVGSSYALVSHAYLDDNDDGIHIRDNSDYYVFDNIISTNNDKSGILSQDNDGFSITNGYFYHNKFNGISVSGGQHFTISGNVMKNNNQEFLGNNYSGIKLNDYSGKPSLYGSITGNSIYDDQATTTQQYGIISEDTSGYFKIANNTIYHHAVASILVADANSSFANNTASSTEIAVGEFFSSFRDDLYISSTTKYFGIGSVAPEYPLHVQGSLPAGTLKSIFRNSNTTNTSKVRLALQTTTSDTDYGYIEASRVDSSNGTLTISARGTTGTLTLNPTSGGAVGIGTSTPTVPLQITSTSANATTTVEIGKTGQNKGTCLKMYNGEGTVTYCSISGTTFSCSATSCQ